MASKSSSSSASGKGKASRSASTSPANPGSPSGAAASSHLPTENFEIEVDPDGAGSVFTQSTLESATSSLRSSILAFKQEHGRRYHSYQAGQYWGPNDERQQEAEDLFHGMYMNIFDGRLCEVDLPSDIQSILDVGCGTGTWAIDAADAYPLAEVIGVDLSPIQPAFVPPNCRFEVDDFLQPWTFPEDKFDYIHMRYISGCVTDWKTFYAEAYKHLKPGGWLQHVEYDSLARSDNGSLKPDSPFVNWSKYYTLIGEKIGKSFDPGRTAKPTMEDAGFINVHADIVKVPVGTWPTDPKLKQWGAWNRMFIMQGLDGFAMRAVNDWMGWSEEKTQLYLMEVRKDLTSPSIHCYLPMYVTYAQKPKK